MGINFNYTVQSTAADLIAVSKRDEFKMEIHIYKPDSFGLEFDRRIFLTKCGQTLFSEHQIASDSLIKRPSDFLPISEATCEACILIDFEDKCTTSE